MIDGNLFKWSISYFAAGLAWLLTAEALMVAGFGFPGAGIRSPDTLVIVHMIAIGWLSMSMCGALLQFVPVLVARPLHGARWTLLALLLLNVGLLTLIGGFLGMGGRINLGVSLLPVGALVLTAGFGLVVINLAMTLWQARPLQGPARFVAVGLACLSSAVVFGSIFAFVLGGIMERPLATQILGSGISIHAIAGLGGWLTLTAMGVSYRLLSMFMLTPEIEDAKSKHTLLASTAGLGVAIVGGSLMIVRSGGLDTALAIAALLSVVALMLYMRDVVALYRKRKRQKLELNTRMAAWSFAGLCAAAIFGVTLAATGSFTRFVGAFGFLLAFGWLSGLMLSMLYKIVAFLTWLETYGPVAGRTVTPRVQDLVAEGRASVWFVLFFLAAWGATAALLAETPVAFRTVLFIALFSTIGIVRELMRIRRLSDVAAALRRPAGASIPRLMVSRN